MNKKLFQTALVIFFWGLLSFCLSILYYWLKEKGIIWDNPDWVKLPTGEWHKIEFDWNSRKVVFAIMSFGYFVLTVFRIILIWNTNMNNA